MWSYAFLSLIRALARNSLSYCFVFFVFCNTAAAQNIASGSTVLATTISTSATPAFQGGTLEINQVGTYGNNFTLQGPATATIVNTIDTHGNAATLSGVISDAVTGTAGSLTITDSVGGGQLTLSGANTYTGVTTINSGATLGLSGTGSIGTSSSIVDVGTFDISGTAAGASIISLSGTGNMTLGARNLTLTNASDTFSGVISGTGGLQLNGGTEVLVGASTYSGGTTISGGTLQIGNGNSTGSITGNVSVSGTLAFDRADAINFDGVISGRGGVSQIGTGSTTLTAVNTYSGATVVSAGTLVLSGGSSISNSSGVAVAGTLDISATTGTSIGSLSGTGSVLLGNQTLTLTAANGTFSGVISGSGGLVLNIGSETLSGANTYTGPTTVNGGTLGLGQAVIANNISNGGTVSFNSNVAIAMSGIVSGAGSVLQNGNGVTTISTAQTYTGATTISFGTLALSGSGSIASSSGVANNAIFDISAASGGATITSLSGTGAVYLGGQTLTLSNASGTYFGTISGSGELNLAGGKETLSGIGSFTGITTIAAGTLYLTSSNSLASSSSVVDNAALDISGVFISGHSLNSSILSLSGFGSVALGSATLVLTNAVDTFSGTLSGAGGLTIGAGAETLTNASNYTGTTTITAGTLILSGAGRLSATGTVAVNGIFDVSAAAGPIVSIGSLSGSGTVNLGANTVNFGSASTVFSGTITGSGGLIVSGGTEVLSGLNSYSGSTTVTAGTLQIGNGSTTGSINGNVTDNGALAFNRSDSATFSGVISGSGGVTQLGSGTTVLTGTNTYTGGTTISAGTLQIGNGGTTGSITGDVGDQGTLAFNRSDPITYGGVISGSGGIEVAGTGTLTLIGVNTYSGITQIDGNSRLAIVAAGSIAASNVVANGTLDLSSGAVAPRFASLSGSGSVILGAQSLTLTNAAGNFSGVATGTGGVTINGGTQTLSGVNTYSGATAINGGTLAVTGSIASSNGVTVNSGGTLAGTGTVPAVTVNSGGTLAAGASGSGTLKVTGAALLASGSTLQVNLSSASSPTLAISGAAAISGALAVSTTDGTYLLGQKMTVLTAANGVSGTFALSPIQSTGAQFSSALSYDANDVYLKIDLAKLSPLLPAGATVNQAAPVSGIDAAIAAGNTLPSQLENLGNITSANFATDATQLSGEIGADLPKVGTALFNPFLNAIFDHISDGQRDSAVSQRSKTTTRPEIWVSAFKGSNIVAGGSTAIGSSEFKSMVTGIVGGADWHLSPKLSLGAAVSAGYTDFRLFNNLGQGKADAFTVGSYGLMQLTPRFYASFAGAVAFDSISTSRIITVSGTDQLNGKADSLIFGGRYETGFALNWATPYLALQDEFFTLPGFSETSSAGADAFALQYGANATNTADLEVGIRQNGYILNSKNWTLRVSDRLAWAHGLSDGNRADANFVALPSSEFSVYGAKATRDSALMSLGTELKSKNGLAFNLHFDSAVSSKSQSYTGMAGASIDW